MGNELSIGGVDQDCWEHKDDYFERLQQEGVALPPDLQPPKEGEAKPDYRKYLKRYYWHEQPTESEQVTKLDKEQGEARQQPRQSQRQDSHQGDDSEDEDSDWEWDKLNSGANKPSLSHSGTPQEPQHHSVEPGLVSSEDADPSPRGRARRKSSSTSNCISTNQRQVALNTTSHQPKKKRSAARTEPQSSHKKQKKRRSSSMSSKSKTTKGSKLPTQEYVTSRIPKAIRDLFGRVGFAHDKNHRRNGNFAPSMCFDPYLSSVTNDLRNVWLKEFRKVDQKGTAMLDATNFPLLMFWYGEETYSVLPRSHFIRYNDATEEPFFDYAAEARAKKNRKETLTAQEEKELKRIEKLQEDLDNFRDGNDSDKLKC